MFNIFEQYWTLLIVAIIALPVMLMVRSMFPEKRHWWQLALPAFLAVAAFGLDWLGKTDLEKINALIKAGITAAEEENCDGIDAIISQNYSDSYHTTKESLMAHCRRILLPPLVEKNSKRSLLIEISPPKAAATLIVLTKFDEKSYVYQSYSKPLLLTKMKLTLQKGPDKQWLINRTEILELDRQPVNWKDVR